MSQGVHRQRSHVSPPLQLSLAVGSRATITRRPLELQQRYPAISLHEELCSIELGCVDVRSVFGPSLVDILHASPLTDNVVTAAAMHEPVDASPDAPPPLPPPPKLYQGAQPEWDMAIDLAPTRLAAVDVLLHDAKRLPSDLPVEDKNVRDLQRRIRNYLLDNGEYTFGAGTVTGDADDVAEEGDLNDFLSETPATTFQNDSRKRPRESSECGPAPPVGLTAAEAAISVDKTLRNHVSNSMPRRKHHHTATDRLVVCPVFGDPWRDGSGSLALSFDPTLLHLDEVVDPALASALERITDFDKSTAHPNDLNLKDHQVREAFAISHAKTHELRQRRRGAPMHELDKKVLQSRKKLFGVDLPSHVRVLSLSEEQVKEAVDGVMQQYLGPSQYFLLKFLTLSYKRHTMCDLNLSGGSGGGQSAASQSRVFKTIDGKLLPNMDAVRESVRAQEEHLRFCGVVDRVEDYTTLVVVVFLVDSRYADMAAAESSSAEEGAFRDIVGEIREAKKGVFQSPNVPSVSLPLGIAVAPLAEAAGELAPMSSSAKISKWFLLASAAINIPATIPPVRADFCCSRDHYELGVVTVHLREFYETVLIERLVRMTRSRMVRLPLSAEYDECVRMVFSKLSASKDLAKAALRQEVWKLQRLEKFLPLFVPDSDDCIGIEEEEHCEIVDAYRKELDVPPELRASYTILSDNGEVGQSNALRKPFVPTESAVVGCLRLLKRLWGQPRQSAPSAATGIAAVRGGISAKRLCNMMVSALVSPAEVHELLIEISQCSCEDPGVTFSWPLAPESAPVASYVFQGSASEPRRSRDDDDDEAGNEYDAEGDAGEYMEDAPMQQQYGGFVERSGRFNTL